MEFLEKILQLDTSFFLFLNGFHNHFWDWVMILITRKEFWLPLYLTLIYFIIRRYKSKSLLIIAMLILLIVACDQLANLAKVLVARERPIYDESIKNIVHQVIRKGGRYGYFSAHAANTFGLFVFTSYLFKRFRYTITFLIWTLIISYSRIYIGVHFPLDVISGMLIGGILGYSFYKIVIFVDNRFFLAANPKIYKTRLKSRESKFIITIFYLLLLTIFLSVYILQKYYF